MKGVKKNGGIFFGCFSLCGLVNKIKELELSLSIWL